MTKHEQIRQIIENLTEDELLDRLINKDTFTWEGKTEAKKRVQEKTHKVLIPCKEESKDFENTQNLYIEGDNFEVLKLLKAEYENKIKMIYIDPPYNTGKDFIYKDNFKQSVTKYKKHLGLKRTDALDYNQEFNRKHSDWLSMMYERLLVARDLLKDDGVIFISIDDNEVHNLRKICDEVFGEGNVESLIWNKEAEGKSGTLKQTLRFRTIHESIIVCYKNKENVLFERISEPLKGRENEFQTANLAVNEDKENKSHSNYYEIISPNNIKWIKHWKITKNEFELLLMEKLIYWGAKGDSQPRRILPTDDRRTVYSTSIIEKGGTTIGRKDFETVMPEDVFSYPKPLSLIKHFLNIVKTENEIALDFFSGSATTAHAVMQLNAKDGGNRKFIMVQIPELTDEKSEAFKAGYKNICEIGKERIKRAGKKILEENKDKDLSSLDIGFRVLKVQ